MPLSALGAWRMVACLAQARDMSSGVGHMPRLATGSDEEARGSVAALFDLYYVELVATARYLVGDRETAEDIVMEAFLALYPRWASLRNPNEAHRYLRSNVLNGSRTQLRRRLARRLHKGPDSGDGARSEDLATAGAEHTALAEALRGLPPRQREVLVLRDYVGMPEVEVAGQLGIATYSVKQHASRGRAALAHGGADRLNVDDDLRRQLTAALAAEAEEIDIDRRAARNRLEQGLSMRDHRRSAGRWLAAAVILAAAALFSWSAAVPNRAISVSPTPSPSPTTEVTPADYSWPFLLDLPTLSMSPLPSQLVPEYPLIPAYGISPDGRRVAIVKCNLTSMGCEGNPWIVVGGLEDLAIHHLPVPDAQLTDVIGWDPDGTKIVVAATDGSAYAVGEFYLIDVATGRTRQITDIPLDHARWWSLQTTFSPDGASVLYDLPRGDGRGVGWDIWSVPVTAAGSAKGTIFLRDAKAPKAIPGTASVAYVTPVVGFWEGSAIGIVDGTGSRRTLVTARTAIGKLVPSPDGRSIAYDDDRGTWVVQVATGATRRVSSSGTPQAWLDKNTVLIDP
jgi:RNA polymerase sigma factor (sigma-70 family)